MFSFYTYKFGCTFETLLNHKCEICVDPRRVFKNDISVMYQLFAPAVGHRIVECVLLLRALGLYLPLQVSVVLGLITGGLVSVPICVPSI